ncbi:RNA polymerase sigma factor [Actinokineospora enzanensis]|uniref:RNA polymerase sigma factor n=1 Tax=Actinokineospora enzanensis TaxID=155975 RepID=UPI00036F0E6A|nr:RNA polymerase sigma factor [Actinokineospora enzanensis]
MTAETGERVTDAELAARFTRDPELFTEVHDRYFTAVYRYVAGRLGAGAAEDIAAETFLVAFDRRGTFDPDRGTLRVWLFGIATNLLARHRRAEARHYRALARVGPPGAVESHESRVVAAVAARGLRPRLAAALARLSVGERDVLLLVALGQLGYEEVAVALGISAGTVGSRLSRARRKLDAILTKETPDD